MAGMAEDQEARCAQQLGAAQDEHLAPPMRAQALPQPGGGSGHNHAAFIELGQGIAQRPSLVNSLFPRLLQGRNVAPVKGRLGLRKGQPDQRVEQVMPVVRTRRDRAGEGGLLLISPCIRRRHDKIQRHAVARDQPALTGCCVQAK
ncbi:MAG: hypothetical protein NTV11_04000 [Rhodocyclales bacterium]|nr:hypothetical protein [Rhodocyclales bacterium]